MAITLGTLTAKTGMTLPWRHGSVTRRGSAGLVAAGIAVVGFACIAMWVKLEETRGSLTAASGVSPAPDARHPPALIGVWQLGIDSVSGDAYIISLANRGVMVQLHDRQVECSRYDEGRRTLRAGWCHSPEVLGTGAWHATASELCIDYSWYAVFPAGCRSFRVTLQGSTTALELSSGERLALIERASKLVAGPTHFQAELHY